MSNASTTAGERSIVVPSFEIDIPNSQDCFKAICGERDYPTKNVANPTSCPFAPRYGEALIQSVVKNGTCKEDQFSISTPPNGMTVVYPEDKYPTVCTFADQSCAELVCQKQRSTINATADGKSWECHSDSAFAQAAIDAKYWFATTNETWTCKGTTLSCKDLKGPSYGSVLPLVSLREQCLPVLSGPSHFSPPQLQL